jgi:hypothetical protein
MWKNHFTPIHAEIVALIKTKGHLREPGDDESFDAYFQHVAGQIVFWDFVEKEIPVEGMNWPSYPAEFFWGIRGHHAKVQARYAATVQELHHTMTPKSLRALYRHFKRWVTETGQDDPSPPPDGSFPSGSSASQRGDRVA